MLWLSNSFCIKNLVFPSSDERNIFFGLLSEKDFHRQPQRQIRSEQFLFVISFLKIVEENKIKKIK
jgi:hypothetical protein